MTEAATAEIFDDGGGEDAATETTATATATDGTQATEGAAAPEAKADEASPSWWDRVAKGKWKTEEDAIKGYSESSREARDQKKRADDAEARWKAHEGLVGAPVDAEGKPAPYDFKTPEGVEMMPELLEAAQATFREMNMAPPAAQKIMDLHLAVEAGIEEGRRMVERDFVVQHLGAGDEAVAKAQINEALAWARATLGEDAEELLTGNGGVSSYGKALVVLQKLHAIAKGASMGAGSGTGRFGESEYQALVAKAVSGPLSREETAMLTDYLNRRAPAPGA